MRYCGLIRRLIFIKKIRIYFQLLYRTGIYDVYIKVCKIFPLNENICSESEVINPHCQSNDTGIHLMKQYAHNWYLPCCQGTKACYHVSFTQNSIYTPVPGVSSSVESRSCPESARCCRNCVITLSWCQSDFDGWGMAKWLIRWLQQWAARDVYTILGSPVRHRHPPDEAIRS